MPLNPDEVRMTFAQHLEELRWRLLKAIGMLLLLAALGLCFQDELFEFWTGPYSSAIEKIQERRAEKGVSAARIDPGSAALRFAVGVAKVMRAEHPDLVKELDEAGAFATEETAAEAVELGLITAAEAQEAGLLDEEAAALAGRRHAEPEETLRLRGSGVPPLKAMRVTETFIAYLKVALLTAALLSAPVFLYQMWQFIGAGLYAREQKVVLRTVPFSMVLFVLGLLFGYTLLVPVGLQFLLTYGDPTVIEPNTMVSSYLSLLFVLLFIMGLVFQIPLVMSVLSAMGLMHPKTFRTKRKFFILGGFVMAALLTPPDPSTQLLVAVPMVTLYEIGIVLATVLYRKRQQPEAPAEGATS